MENSNRINEDQENVSSNNRTQGKRRARSQRFSRAKTGCFTCRARRKKCDETRDEKTGSCQRCLKSGIECLGFPSVRSAPLAAHSKKHKADQNEQPQSERQQQQQQQDIITTTTASSSQSASIPPPPAIDSSTGLEFFLGDFFNSNNPSINFAKSINPLLYGGRLNSGNNSPARSHSPGNSLFDSLVHTSSGQDLLSTASPLPQFVLEDWNPADLLESFPTENIIQRSLPSNHQSAANNANGGGTSRILSPFPGMRGDEERALKSLATFYSAFCMSWWLPRRGMRSKRRHFQHVVNAMERRLRRSEIACTTVAAVAACYGFGVGNSHFDNAIIEPFRQSWERIYEVVCDSKTSSLCAYLDWLGASTSFNEESLTNEEKEQRRIELDQTKKDFLDMTNKRIRANSTSEQSEGGESEDAFTQKQFIEAQADKLFSFASKVLAKVALAAKQDQSVSDDILIPLEFAALIHVDVYLQAAMDLALFAFASRPEHIFHRELDAAGSLLESLLGRGQCVRLSEIDGVEAVGFRTFVWTDITNSVLSARCTRLHYLLEEPGRMHEQQENDTSQPESANLTADEGVNEEQRRTRKRRGDLPTSNPFRKHRGISISFGCPDDILVVFAHIANLHFQLRQARTTGAIKGNGAESLPAWALHTAHDLTRRIEESERIAATSQPNNSLYSIITNDQDRSRIQFEEGQRRLAAMWRHAAIIFLHTIAYRIGPLGKTNQERMKGIIELWNSSDMEINLIENGNPAMPMLFAAFIAQQRSEREICREALKRIGQHEQSRMGYRQFVERLWRETDERGFAILWHDLLDEEWANKIAIM